MLGSYSFVRTKSGVEHVESHLVALLGSSDGDQTLVAVILRFVDLDHTSTQVPDLVDLGTTLTNDGTDHVIGDVDLLGQWLAGDNPSHRCSGRSAMRLSRLRSTVRRGLMRTSTGVRCAGRSIVKGRLCDRGWGGLAVEVRDTISTGRCPVWLSVVSLERVWMTVLSTSRLRNIGHHLHTARNDTSRTTASGGVGRSSWSSKPLSELLDQGHSHIVGGNMHSISNTKNDKRTLSGQRKACIRGIQTRSGSFLDLANPDTALANDRTDEDMGDKETKGIRPRLGSRRGLERLVVKCTDNQSEGLKKQSATNLQFSKWLGRETYLGDSILRTADGQDTLYCTTGVVANSALGTRQTADLGDIFPTFSNASRSLLA